MQRESELEAATTEMVAAAAELMALLRDSIRDAGGMRRFVAEGGTLRTFMESGDAGTQRAPIDTALARFEAARNRVRRAVIVQAVAEGMSISAPGRALGISRQWAVRLMAKGDP